jgi:hypothetical protein
MTVLLLAIPKTPAAHDFIVELATVDENLVHGVTSALMFSISPRHDAIVRIA